ncbi:Uncharacterised protein [uncultured archaeon]|nr:Uncharacterised protein [uncultured archaeon]
MPEGCRADKKDILKALGEIRAKKGITFEKEVRVPKTSSNKQRYVVDLREGSRCGVC